MPIVQEINRSGRAFEPANAVIRIDCDDQDVAQRFGVAEIRNVSPVEKVEAAICKDDSAPSSPIRFHARREPARIENHFSLSGNMRAHLERSEQPFHLKFI